MTTESKWTAGKIRALKGRGKFACLTAYDYTTARLLDEAGLPLVLVGDSLATPMLGYADTLPVTMAEMLHHAAAVARGVKSALVVADMPFMSYQVSISQAIENAGRFIKEAKADAVKIEGGAFRTPTVKALIENGIPVLGHIGLTPQSIHAMGGYKVQGKKPAEAQNLLQDASALTEAGVFAVVLECMPPALGREITRAIPVPTIGIGAGPDCDGQILVTTDLLGLFSEFTPKFVKRYASLGTEMNKAFAAYKADVAKGTFPGPEHCY
ncbi:MAG: 3-methyl-2-oxobutanoate hydroxymethyltransferase [Kiritimatiellae bacterium]|nr:3-methyl-2-oxobutanoate hydroxymethyltransferase [Kiritimatiellia bacterium]